MTTISIADDYRLQFLEAVRSLRARPVDGTFVLYGMPVPPEGRTPNGKLQYYGVTDALLEILKRRGIPFDRSN